MKTPQIKVVQIHTCDKCGNEKPKDDQILCLTCRAEAHAARLQWSAEEAINYSVALLTACNCHTEAAAINDPTHNKLLTIHNKVCNQVAELLNAAKLALIHLDQCHDYDAESAQAGAQAIAALRNAIKNATR